MLKSDIITVINPPYVCTLRFYPDMIRVKRIKEEDIPEQGSNWVRLNEKGKYRFFGGDLLTVRCARMQGPKLLPELK